MPKVSVSEAARLVGKSRITLHRHIERGKLSKELDEAGNPVIDTAELLRVYGALRADTGSRDVAKKQPDTSRNSLLEAEVEALRERLAAVEVERERERQAQRETIEDLRGERDRLLEIVNEQAGTVRLLTDQRQPRRRWWRFGRG